MTSAPRRPAGAQRLRRLAEKRLKEELPDAAAKPSVPDAQRLLHELQVHQIELEMQNDELRRTKDELELGLQHQAELYEFAPMGYVTLDERGAVLQENRKAVDLFGRDEPVRRRALFVNRVAPDHRPLFKAFLTRTLDSRSRQTCELTLLGRAGSPFPAHLEAAVVSDGPTAGLRCLLAVIDVTEARLAQEALEGARDAAQAADRAKSAFLANMSHEIRTPMSGVLGMLRLLRATSLDVAQRRYADLAAAAADQLLHIIDEILDFSKIEAGRLDLERVAFNPGLVVEESARSLASVAREKGLRLSWQIAAGVPGAVVGDPFRLRQVLVNLIGNAVKFTEKGGVKVSVCAAAGPAGRTCLHVEVRDTGVGIPADRRDRLFLRFSQADDSTARGHGGTGLGLAISKQLVERMGGSIRVESEEGRGSVFAFSIPFDVAPAVPRERNGPAESGGAASPLPARLRVLVADDEPVNREVAVTYLRQRGWQVMAVGDGQAAVEALATGHFDVILMDVRMPGLDGFEATRRIREQEGSGGRRVWIIGLTAHALRGDRERCLEAGMDDYLAKPVEPETLYAAVGRTVVDAPARAPASKALDPTVLGSLVARLGGGAEKKAALVRTFLGSLNEGLEKIREALGTGDATQVAYWAHRLAGTLSVFGFETGQGVAQEVETLASEAGLRGVGELVTRLEEEVAEVKLLLSGRAGDGA